MEVRYAYLDLQPPSCLCVEGLLSRGLSWTSNWRVSYWLLGEMQPALQRRSSSGGIEAQRARPLTLATALRSPPVARAPVTSGRTKMAAASLLERHGGSFFSVCLSRSPLGVLVIAMRASARDSNLAARHTRLLATRLHAPVTIHILFFFTFPELSLFTYRLVFPSLLFHKHFFIFQFLHKLQTSNNNLSAQSSFVGH